MPPRSALDKKLHRNYKPPGSTLIDALEAFEVAKHQAEGSFSLLQRLAARQVATHDLRPQRFWHRELIDWTKNSPVLKWGRGERPLDKVPLDAIAHLLHTSLPWFQKVWLFRWLSEKEGNGWN